MQDVVQVQQLLALALHQLGDRDARPAGHNLRDLLLRDLVAQKVCLRGLALFRDLLFLCQLLLQLRQLAILIFGGLVQIIGAFGLFDLCIDLLNFLAQLLHFADGLLFVFPLCLHFLELGAQVRQFLLDVLQMLLRQRVGVLFQGRFLDFMLHDLAGNLIQLGRHGVDLRADHGARFVHQVDGLIRQETVGNIAVGERRRGNQRLILDLDAVEHLITFL